MPNHLLYYIFIVILYPCDPQSLQFSFDCLLVCAVSSWRVHLLITHTCWGFSDCVFSFHLNLLSVYMAAVFSGSGCAWQLSNVMTPWHEQIWIRHTGGEETRKALGQRHNILMTGLNLLPRWSTSLQRRKTIYWLASGKHIQILFTFNIYLTKHWSCTVKIKVLKTVPL